MLKKMANFCSVCLYNRGIIKKADLPIYEYGFQILYSTLSGVLSIIVLSMLVFNIYYALVFLSVFMPLRTFTGGYHCKTSFGCFIFSNLYFLAVAFFSRAIGERYIFLTILACLLVSIYIFINSPVLQKNQRLNASALKRGTICSKIILVVEQVFIALSLLFLGKSEYITLAYITICLDGLLMAIAQLEARLIKTDSKTNN